MHRLKYIYDKSNMQNVNIGDRTKCAYCVRSAASGLVTMILELANVNSDSMSLTRIFCFTDTPSTGGFNFRLVFLNVFSQFSSCTLSFWDRKTFK